MHIKQFEAEYTYDCDLDVANIEVKNDYTHEKSIDLAFGVFWISMKTFFRSILKSLVLQK